jgi:hypothetical protein
LAPAANFGKRRGRRAVERDDAANEADERSEELRKRGGVGTWGQVDPPNYGEQEITPQEITPQEITPVRALKIY